MSDATIDTPLPGALGAIGITRGIIREALAEHREKWRRAPSRKPMKDDEQVAHAFMDGADWMASVVLEIARLAALDAGTETQDEGGSE